MPWKPAFHTATPIKGTGESCVHVFGKALIVERPRWMYASHRHQEETHAIDNRDHPTRRSRPVGPGAVRIPGREGTTVRLPSYGGELQPDAAAFLCRHRQDARAHHQPRGVRLG